MYAKYLSAFFNDGAVQRKIRLFDFVVQALVLLARVIWIHPSFIRLPDGTFRILAGTSIIQIENMFFFNKAVIKMLHTPT